MDTKSLERRLQILEQSSGEKLQILSRQRDQVRHAIKRRHQKSVAMARAVFVLTCGKTESFKGCCAEYGLDVDTTGEDAEKYVQKMNDQTLENECERLRTTMFAIPVAARKFVLEHSLVTWVGDLNEKAGFAPSYRCVLSGRAAKHEELFGGVPTDFRSVKAGSQWSRRFVKRHKLTRGRIERHVHDSAAQLLIQVSSG